MGDVEKMKERLVRGDGRWRYQRFAILGLVYVMFSFILKFICKSGGGELIVEINAECLSRAW